MGRGLISVLLALLLSAGVALAAHAPAASPWFTQIRACAIKTIDLDSIGTGLSVNVYATPARSLWADGCFLYDGSSNLVGGFGGLSTEPDGLPLLDSLSPLCDTVGLGVKLLDDNVSSAAYLTVHF